MPPRRPLACPFLWQHCMTLRESYAELAATEASTRGRTRFCPGAPLPVSATNAGMSVGALRSLVRSEPAIRADSSTISSIA